MGLPAAQSLESLWRELDRWLGHEPATTQLPSEPRDSNPFSALYQLLVAFFRWLTGKRVVTQSGDELSADTHVERMIRSQVAGEARQACAMLCDALKMSFPAGRKGMDEI